MNLNIIIPSNAVGYVVETDDLEWEIIIDYGTGFGVGLVIECTYDSMGDIENWEITEKRDLDLRDAELVAI